MFECRACLRRLVTAVLPDVEQSHIRNLRRPGPRIAHIAPRPVSPSLIQRRFQSSEAVLQKKPSRAEHANSRIRRTSSRAKVPARIDVAKTKIPRSSRAGAAKSTALSTRHARQEVGHSSIDVSGKLSLEDRRRLNHSLKYLVDPLRLAEYVERQLKKNRLEEALKMVRYASSQKEMKCTVGWNHVINWLMLHDRANAAIKIFNEVLVHHQRLRQSSNNAFADEEASSDTRRLYLQSPSTRSRRSDSPAQRYTEGSLRVQLTVRAEFESQTDDRPYEYHSQALR